MIAGLRPNRLDSAMKIFPAGGIDLEVGSNMESLPAIAGGKFVVVDERVRVQGSNARMRGWPPSP